jgi:hypothetical protein
LCKRASLLGGRPFEPGGIQGETDHEPVDLFLFSETADCAHQRGFIARIERRSRVGEHSEVVGDGHSDAGQSEIKGTDSHSGRVLAREASLFEDISAAKRFGLT